MKILFVISSMNFGGAERVLSIVANELSRRGHKVGIYMTNSTSESVYPLEDKVTLFGEEKLTNVKGSVKKLTEIIKRLRRSVFEYDPDIVVPFLTFNCIYASFALAFTKYPVIVCERNDPHLIMGSNNVGKLHFIVRDIAFFLARGAVFQSKGASQCFSDSIQKKSVVIMNPISVSATSNERCSERDRRIVTVGRFVPQKNHKLLLCAFKKITNEYPELILELYGDGPDREELVRYTEELNLTDKVRFAGNVSNVGDRIKDAAIFAFTSDYEGMPNALAEAMSLGVPCVSTDCSPGAARILIENGENGLIVPCGDAQALAVAFRKLLSDPQYSESLGKKATSVNDKLNVDVIVSQWENYLTSKIKNSSGKNYASHK